jgi:putative acetyltransferase
LGCVLVGEPEYYSRFGFRSVGDLTLEGAPAEYFMCLSFDGERVQGIVSHHPAFNVCG